MGIASSSEQVDDNNNNNNNNNIRNEQNQNQNQIYNSKTYENNKNTIQAITSPTANSNTNTNLNIPASYANNADDVVPTVFKWDHGGRNVYITGTFNNWERQLPMHKSGNDFTYIFNLVLVLLLAVGEVIA